ncbi:MAG: hypothetical protein B7Y25_02635 [Alphaproteobacteria bacterium 16-39-46]|nr:MAG: hypothetical protein B7Y25_02635 [Alphaproteobacteria bacterium 16-39-46]OZA42644.1 MAG: hypothetical protein B7X84_05405 [Alphaproteobacteria bacterium 17-39-52]HQS83824.1 outer membrane protein assembly factor BamE [Alphaproteobacteria bacterium]HQS93678.1 outer membrane protein assembly factor BamE [Alphaproteobacteria bacterium]
MRHLKRLIPVIIISTAPFLTGCAPFSTIHGNLPDAETVSKVKKGETTKAQVLEILGPPTSIAPFNPKVWYYIGERVERVAFFDPDVMEKEIFMVTFNDEDILESFTPIERPHDFEIEPNTRKTKTLGQDPSLMQQMFGNFGKFSRQKETKK